MLGTVWFIRFPMAARDAGPYRFDEPIDENWFIRAMEERFGCQIGEEECTLGTKVWTEAQEPLTIGKRCYRPQAGKLTGYRDEIRARRAKGEKVTVLATAYGVTRAAIYNCLRD